MEHLQEEIKRATRTGSPLSVVMLDIDHFKGFNDRYGHKGGDLALQEVARRIAGAVRETDTVGRFGGEEFLLILPDTDKEGAIAVAEKVRGDISSKPLMLEGENAAGMTVSLGVATLPDDAETVDLLLDGADRFLYRAKELGRNRIGNLAVQAGSDETAVPGPAAPPVTSDEASGSGSRCPKSGKSRKPPRPNSHS
jgi:diguanylate cyclase (GGDEF)-like protein